MSYKLQAIIDLGTRNTDVGYKQSLITEVISNGFFNEYEYFEYLSGNPLEAEMLANKIKPNIIATLSCELYLKHKGYFTHLSIKEMVVTLVPIEPFKTKTSVDGKTDIDIAFYMNQLLNLCDDIQLKGLFAEAT